MSARWLTLRCGRRRLTHLRPPDSTQPSSRFLAGFLGNRNVVYHRPRTRCLRHSSRGAFVLNYIRFAFPGGYATLDTDLKPIAADF